jgi:hypothetical protein
MANVKISALTAKAATLEVTDRVAIADYNGTTYDTKYVTGQEVKDLSTLVTLGSTITATRDILESDRDKIIPIDTYSGAVNININTNATNAITIGAQMMFYVLDDTNAVTVTATGGVALLAQGSKVTANGLYACFTLIKIATDSWVLAGNLI